MPCLPLLRFKSQDELMLYDKSIFGWGATIRWSWTSRSIKRAKKTLWSWLIKTRFAGKTWSSRYACSNKRVRHDDNDKSSCEHKQSTSAITKAIKNLLAGKTRTGHHRLHLLKMNTCITKPLQYNTKHLEASRAIAENMFLGKYTRGNPSKRCSRRKLSCHLLYRGTCPTRAIFRW